MFLELSARNLFWFAKKKPLIRKEKLVEKLEKSRDIFYIDSIVREMLHFRK